MTEPSTVEGIVAQVFTLTHGRYRARVTDLGARLLELQVPDRNGTLADIVLQRSTFDDMAHDGHYMGATAGRYANRIRAGRFTLDGAPIQLARNEGNNHLHGGVSGFDRKIWATDGVVDGNAVTFRRTSPDGEEGYPGALAASVTYRLGEGVLDIDITATTDAPTVVNIVNHAYFNLGGHDAGTILDHLLEVRASHYLPVDEELLPTGEIAEVAGTAFDFRTPAPIGGSYDHNWVLDGEGLRPAVVATDPVSGRRLTLSTNQPGVQIYTGAYMDGLSGKDPVPAYPAFGGFTLETQTFPDGVNQPHFPASTLDPGQTYHHMMRFEFSAT